MAINKDHIKSDANTPSTNGIITVNDDANPTPEERDALIGKEPDTDRLRSERESVEQSSAIKKD